MTKELKRFAKDYEFESEILKTLIQMPHYIHICYDFSTVEEMLNLEFMRLLELDLRFIKCQRCVKYFLRKTEKDARYCNRIQPGTNKTCKDLAAIDNFKEKNKDNIPLQIYNLYYKRYVARIQGSSERERQFNEWKYKSCKGQVVEGIEKTASLKVAMKNMAIRYRCRAVAIQCWTALQDMSHIMPCLANALLSDEGIPVVCETDIHGAITAVMTQAATMNEKPQFFADLTIRHHKDDNMELLWHCGNFPYSMAKNKDTAYAGEYWIAPTGNFGTCMWKIDDGDLTIIRFDGDHGNYSMFIGEAQAVDGPSTGGSYTLS